MGSTIRTMTIAVRLDVGPLSADVKQGLDLRTSFARQETQLNAQMEASYARLEKARSKAITGESLMGKGKLSWAEQEVNLKKFDDAKAQVAKVQQRADEALTERRIALGKNEFNVRSQLEDQLFARTHTHEEVLLRDAQRRRDILLSTQSASLRPLILQNYEAERAAILAPAGAGGARHGLGERGLARVGRSLGAAVGMSGVGGEVGSLAGIAAFAPELAAVAAVGLTVGAVAEKVQAHLQLMREIQKGYNQDLRESARWWEDIGGRSNTALGRSAGQRAAALREKVTELGEAQTAREHAPGFGQGWLTDHGGGVFGELSEDFDAIIHGGGTGNKIIDALVPALNLGNILGTGTKTWKTQEEQAESARRSKLTQEAKKLDLIRDEGTTRQQGRDVADWQRRAAESGTSLIVNEPERRRQELADHAAREKEGLRRKQEDERLTLQAGTDESVKNGTIKKAEGEKRLAEQAAAQEAERKSAETEAENRRVVLERELAEKRAADRDRTSDLTATAGMPRGYEREKTGLWARQQSELNAGVRAGWDQEQFDNLGARQAAETKDLKADRDERMRETEVQSRIKLAEVTRDYATADSLARQEEERRLTLAGATSDELKKLMELYDQNRAAAANQQVEASLRDVNRELEVQTGHMTRLEAARQRIAEQNPRADADKAGELADKQEELRLRGKYESPLDKWKREREDITSARDRHIITPERAQLELQRSLREIMPQSQAKVTSGSESSWRDLQDELLGNGEVPKLTLEEMKQVTTLLTDLKTNGMPLRSDH